jgi:hypothetical protein
MVGESGRESVEELGAQRAMCHQNRIKGISDFVFLFDLTGEDTSSRDTIMSSFLSFVASHTLGPKFGTIHDPRFKVIGYRGCGHSGEADVVESPFTTLADDLRAYLARMGPIRDGGARPLLEILYRLATMPASEKGKPHIPVAWHPRGGVFRIVVAFCDAPFVPRENYPVGCLPEDIMNAMMSSKIRFLVYAAGGFSGLDPLFEMDMSELHLVPVPDGLRPQQALAKFVASGELFSSVVDRVVPRTTISPGVDLPPNFNRRLTRFGVL